MANGAKASARDFGGVTALGRACWGGDLVAAEAMLSAGADPNVPYFVQQSDTAPWPKAWFLLSDVLFTLTPQTYPGSENAFDLYRKKDRGRNRKLVTLLVKYGADQSRLGPRAKRILARILNRADKISRVVQDSDANNLNEWDYSSGKEHVEALEYNYRRVIWMDMDIEPDSEAEDGITEVGEDYETDYDFGEDERYSLW
ncbi:hypothetical protein B0T26DRAFT_752786 [Lasiosphaeria miniovina]|uniref:Ankyrin repeat protein n=1 Tax=Lasiosphaeria miniovina TaxID=1954250 RepID=A0AA40DR84_9PEZI|nr:uncharacterized protein B0T26DRAFT_752786 [Lasiosphaeria miniovina]KAK0712565.1 hypothetical protein B0T26DRAFT_752786 [Lasiosphaeria miniovina]